MKWTQKHANNFWITHVVTQSTLNIYFKFSFGVITVHYSTFFYASQRTYFFLKDRQHTCDAFDVVGVHVRQ